MGEHVDDVFMPSTVTGVVVMVLYAAYKVLKHVRMRSTCCGMRGALRLDLSPGHAALLGDGGGPGGHAAAGFAVPRAHSASAFRPLLLTRAETAA